MNRIDQLFSKKRDNILTLYFTAGFPELHSTAQIIKLLAENGVDMIEIGIPFSDPLADGETIQKSSQKALQNGMSIKLLFEQLQDIRYYTQVPLVLMGYLNPVLQFGVENFCQKCTEVGIDGIILPDLPVQEYQNEYQAIFEKYGLHKIFLITPQTSPERIRKIDAVSRGFVYLVSQATTTGTKTGINTEQEQFFAKIRDMNLKNPLLVGFGIADAESFRKACKYAYGAIIGSAFIKYIEQNPNLEQSIPAFVQKIRPNTQIAQK
ncbi:MAG: tryptophan synthase subunit alpha [Raineya sp.]|nr:tryptophan synthase subunit alpha [Raineya sp.]MDW8295535.1 tryptophan synthase subunit alpha [Raineya sp.]